MTSGAADPPALRVRPATAAELAGSGLVVALDGELAGRYPDMPPRPAGALPDGVLAARLVELDGVAVGCGVIVAGPAPGSAEMRRVYVRPEARGRGAARALVASLEAAARQLGLRRMLLETGDRQVEAEALYRACGYAPVPAFGPYVGRPWSRCYARAL